MVEIEEEGNWLARLFWRGLNPELFLRKEVGEFRVDPQSGEEGNGGAEGHCTVGSAKAGAQGRYLNLQTVVFLFLSYVVVARVKSWSEPHPPLFVSEDLERLEGIRDFSQLGFGTAWVFSAFGHDRVLSGTESRLIRGRIPLSFPSLPSF